MVTSTLTSSFNRLLYKKSKIEPAPQTQQFRDDMARVLRAASSESGFAYLKKVADLLSTVVELGKTSKHFEADHEGTLKAAEVLIVGVYYQYCNLDEPTRSTWAIEEQKSSALWEVAVALQNLQKGMEEENAASKRRLLFGSRVPQDLVERVRTSVSKARAVFGHTGQDISNTHLHLQKILQLKDQRKPEYKQPDILPKVDEVPRPSSSLLPQTSVCPSVASSQPTTAQESGKQGAVEHVNPADPIQSSPNTLLPTIHSDKTSGRLEPEATGKTGSMGSVPCSESVPPQSPVTSSSFATSSGSIDSNAQPVKSNWPIDENGPISTTVDPHEVASNVLRDASHFASEPLKRSAVSVINLLRLAQASMLLERHRSALTDTKQITNSKMLQLPDASGEVERGFAQIYLVYSELSEQARASWPGKQRENAWGEVTAAVEGLTKAATDFRDLSRPTRAEVRPLQMKVIQSRNAFKVALKAFEVSAPDRMWLDLHHHLEKGRRYRGVEGIFKDPDSAPHLLMSDTLTSSPLLMPQSSIPHVPPHPPRQDSLGHFFEDSRRNEFRNIQIAGRDTRSIQASTNSFGSSQRLDSADVSLLDLQPPGSKLGESAHGHFFTGSSNNSFIGGSISGRDTTTIYYSKA